MRPLAIFLIMLVVLIPINTSLIFADVFYQDAKVYGEDGIKNFRKQFDSTTIEIGINIDDKEVAPQNVLFGLVPFSSCTPDATGFYTCKFISPSKDNLVAGEQSYTIKVTDGNDVLSQYEGSYVVDAKAPIVKSVDIAQGTYGKGNITVRFSVTDSNGASKRCSGIGKIFVYRDNVSLVKTLEKNNNLCTYNGNAQIEGVGFSSSGKHSICIAATDRLGQMSDKTCKEINVDLDAPTINSVRILDGNGKKIGYIRSGQSTYSLVVNFSDETGIKNAKAILSSLNPSMVSAVLGSCDSKSCKWPVQIYAQSSGVFAIPINITDNADNTKEVSTSVSVDIDNLAPEVIDIFSEMVIDGKYYLGKDSQIFVAFSESGSGLDKDDIKLNLADVDGRTGISADNCTSTCVWSKITPKSDGEVKVSVKGKDRAGNKIKGNTSATLIALTKPPIVKSSNWTTAGKYSGYNLSYAIVGDTVMFEFLLPKGNSPKIIAAADFRPLGIKTQNLTPGYCELNMSMWSCKFQSKIESAGQKNINFQFKDIVGNAHVETIAIDIKGEDNSTQNYWTGKAIKTSPKEIDRQTTQYINQRVFSQIKFSPTTSAQAIKIELVSCAGENNQSISDYESLDLKNSTLKWQKLTLPSDSYEDIDTMSVNCEYSIVSLVKNSFIHTETITVTTPISFYNMPMGKISDSVQQEIDDVRNSWLVKMTWLDTAQKVLKLANMICQLYDMLNSIMIIFSTLKDLLCPFSATVVSNAAEHTAGIGALLENAGLKSLKKGVDTICLVASCRLIDKVLEKLGVKSVGEILGKITFNDGKPRSVSETMDVLHLNIEDSLPLSMLFLCLKGIVKNLIKARNIECQYISCLKNDVPAGKPIQICSMVRGYMSCKWIYEQMFNLIPFARVFDQFAGVINQILTNPLVAIGVATKAICTIQCEGKVCGMCTACSFLDVLNLMVDVYKNLEGMMDSNYFKFEDTICEQALAKD